MPDEDARVRALVEEGWASGECGAGLVLADRKLLTWRSLAWGGPHHYDVLSAFAIANDEVAAFLAIEPDGGVRVLTGLPAMVEIVEEALGADARLRVVPQTWDFSGGEAGTVDADKPPAAP